MQNRKENLKIWFFDKSTCISLNFRRIFSVLQTSMIYVKRHLLWKFWKNQPQNYATNDFFPVFHKQIFPAVISVWFPWTRRRKIRLIFLFQTITFISKNTNFRLIFFAKTRFSAKNFLTPENYLLKTAIIFFPDRCPIG